MMARSFCCDDPRGLVGVARGSDAVSVASAIGARFAPNRSKASSGNGFHVVKIVAHTSSVPE